MTCEIAVANRLGIALAADSAVTFTKEGLDGRQTSTYSSGANKILQPLRNEPVGLMVYDNAALGEIPWELVVKQFRAWEGANPEPQLSTYMDRMIEFIEGSNDLFPMDWREAQTQSLYGVGLVRLIGTLRKQFPIVDDPQSAIADRVAAAGQFALDIEAELDAAGLVGGLSEVDFANALADHALNLVNEATAAIQSSAGAVANVIDAATFLRLAVKVAFKWPWEVAGPPSGVVIAGYGAAEVLPSFVERAFFGFVGTRVYSVERSAKAVPRSGVVGAIIEAFARKSMVETFTQGVSPQAWAQAEAEFRLRAGELIVRTVAEAGPAAVAPQGAIHTNLVDDATEQFKRHWAQASLAAHWQPLLEVVTSLPMDQLAELAENLVMLESLKERVTHRTQSVGGPIDVAVITKSEGLVWIKRKHYFRAELNHRYLGRVAHGG